MFVKTKPIKRNKFDKDLYEEVKQEFNSRNGCIFYEEFDGCCGVYELFGFDNLPDYRYSATYRPYVVKFFKEEFEWGERAVVVVTLADYQYKTVGPILKSIGFKKASEGKNSGPHGANITVYTKVITPPKRKKRG